MRSLARSSSALSPSPPWPASPSILLQSVGATVPVGTSQISVVLTRRASGSTLDTGVPPAPLAETCSATLVVVGR